MNWYLLGFFFKVFNEHPVPFYIGVPPGIKLLDFFIRSINSNNTYNALAADIYLFNLPTTLTGFLCGSNPKVYWKIPRP